MRIDNLHIENFRCFEDRTFFFDERFTLLIGANATGKTAILDAMAIAPGAASSPVPNAPSRAIQRQEARRTYRQAGEIGYFEEHYPTRITASGSIEEVELEWTREPRSGKSRTTRIGTRAVRDAMDSLVRRNRNDEGVVLPCIGYYGTSRLWVEQRLGAGGKLEPARQGSRYTGYQNCLTPTSPHGTWLPGPKPLSHPGSTGQSPGEPARPGTTPMTRPPALLLSTIRGGGRIEVGTACDPSRIR